MTCKNCEQIIDGNFCKHCGQSTKVDKINLPNFLREFSSSVLPLDKGLLYTFTELCVRPGHSIREYIEGKRKSHFKPIAYAFTLSTVYFLLSQFLGSNTFLDDFLDGFSRGSSLSEQGAHRLQILNWLAKNYAYTALLLIPVFAFATYVVFRGAGYNYLEHVVLNAFISGQQAVFYSLASILISSSGHENLWALLSFWISLLFNFWALSQFFSEQSRVAVFFRTLLSYVIHLVLITFLLFIVFVISQ